MLNFPKSTEYGKKIPKEKFYAKLDISASMKRCFVEDIDQIVWQNKLATSTLNVGNGVNIIEIDVLEVSLKKKECSYTVFEFLDKNLPNHTVFVITFANEGQLLINYKESIENRVGKHKITATYKTDWMPLDHVKLSIEGLNLDKVYESFVAQIADSKLVIEPHTDIKQAILESQAKDKLQKDIIVLESRIKTEKQFNIQVKLSTKLKELRSNLSKI
jgi:hypothetical protein